MNVMVCNKYKDLLMSLNLEVMKKMEGVFNVDEIVDAFSNFYYDKMILDITAIRDYQNIDNLQKLAMNINMDNVILLLDDAPESESKTYLSKLISLGIYNFTRNSDGINYLLVHPNSYKDVVNIHDVSSSDVKDNNSTQKPENVSDNTPVSNGRMRVIGFKNVTMHAGATSLIYMLKKTLSKKYKVSAIEVNKVDFLYLDDKELISTTSIDLPKEIMKQHESDIVLVDLNDYDDVTICSSVIYLLEPSTLMVNKMIKKNRNIFEILQKEKVVLNKCCLSKDDVSNFEYETKLIIFDVIPPINDRNDDIDKLSTFISKLGL